ncbi:MAG: DUF4293 domain-containing protein [Bacteroidota bacterium]|nr:DUF4293 domain-containing protein [Bacteroidota bacterium]
MIQRIQTLFLLGVVILSIALFFIPLSEKSVTDVTTGETSKYTMLLADVSKADGPAAPVVVATNYPVLIVNLLLMVMSLYTIFIFKNRTAQIRLCMLGGLLAAVQLILIFYYSDAMGPVSITAHYLPGVYLVAAQVFLLLAARRFIRKDDMMVKAANRIR